MKSCMCVFLEKFSDWNMVEFMIPFAINDILSRPFMSEHAFK